MNDGERESVDGRPDVTAWPVVTVDVSGLDGAGARRGVMDALETSVARGDRFALVARMPPGGERRVPRPGAAIAEIRRLRAIRRELVARCRGLAFVVSARDLAPQQTRLERARRLWGCPVMVTESIGDAERWARAQLAASGRDPDA